MWRYDLIDGESDYYIMKRDDKKVAIFHKDNPKKPISRWWDDIDVNGLIKGESDYYIVSVSFPDTYRNIIFHKDNPNKPISKIWLKIPPEGLIEGKSDYYKAQKDDGKEAIFHKNYKDIPLTDWDFYVDIDDFIEKYKDIPISKVISNRIKKYIKGLC